MVTVQVVNHGGCHQGLHVWESLWTLIRYWMLPRWMWTSAVKTGRAVLFSQTLEPLFILLRNVSARGWMISDIMRSCHLSGSRATRWSQPTRLHGWSPLYYTQADQGSAFPLPWDKGAQLHLFQLSVCRQKSLGLLFSDFLCNFRGAVVQPNWLSGTMQPLALSSHPGASKTEPCATKERKSLSQPKPEQEGRQLLVIFGDVLFCVIKDEIPLSWHE